MFESQIAAGWAVLLGLLSLLGVSRWHYWQGRCVMIEELRRDEACALRKRVKANGKLIDAYDKRAVAAEEWMRDLIGDVVDTAIPDAAAAGDNPAAGDQVDGG